MLQGHGDLGSVKTQEIRDPLGAVAVQVFVDGFELLLINGAEFNPFLRWLSLLDGPMGLLRDS